MRLANAVERVALHGRSLRPRSARSTSAASSSRRGVVAAKIPSAGNGTQTSRPDGERSHAASTDFQLGTIDGLQPELLELAQRERGEAVAAALVAREHRLVDDDDGSAGAGQQRRRGRAGRAGTDDDNVGDVGSRRLQSSAQAKG